MSVSITLTFRWPMGHRILGLTGGGAKCRNIHGHNWTADVELPNEDGQLEFGDVKKAVGDWIDQHWDHGFMADGADPFTAYLHSEGLKYWTTEGPPTTEKIASVLAGQVRRLTGVKPKRVHVLEGYRNAATWEDH